MDWFFPSLDTCDPGMACLDDDARRQYRNGFFWKQDGMHPKHRRTSSRGKGRRGRATRNKKETGDNDRSRSYSASRRSRKAIVESDTEMTYPSTGTSHSSDSEEPEWTRHTAALQNNKKSAATRHQKQYGEPTRQRKSYEILEEPAVTNVWSSDDSVGAVKTSRKGDQSAKHEEIPYNASAFDYIRKASRKFSNPVNDPPSDKSMATFRSIRANDVAPELLRRGIVRPKDNKELARALLKQRQLGLKVATISE